jgi:hypothetical protein
MQIIDARIYDMRAKVPNDKRLFGYVYLENTDMSARFQFTQIDKAELSTAEELHRRTVGFTYVQHQMVLQNFLNCFPLLYCVKNRQNIAGIYPDACEYTLVIGGPEF